MFSPLEQFKVMPYIRAYDNVYDITISNYTYYIIISMIIGMYIMKNKRTIISNRKEKIGELLYKNVESSIKDLLGDTAYIPMAILIFLFILINNIIGLIPYSFTITSHIIYTFFLSTTIILGTTLLGIVKHKFKFIKLFIPSGIDTTTNMVYVIPLIFIIELISYISRVVSLSVRLTANMISGHLLMHIITNLGIHLSIWLFFIPIFLIFPIYILEFGVCLIQSYVFTILTISYIKDVKYLH